MTDKKASGARLPMDDERIIELYFCRDERAIEETDLKYRAYLFTVARNILHNDPDCEECISDTYLGAWNAIPPTRPKVLLAFLTVILRRVSIKRYHKNTKASAVPSELTHALSELEAFVSVDVGAEEEFDAKALSAHVSDFVRTLSARRRFIFMSRYYAAESIDSIASRLSISRSSVNKELSKIRRALMLKLKNEGYMI